MIGDDEKFDSLESKCGPPNRITLGGPHLLW